MDCLKDSMNSNIVVVEPKDSVSRAVELMASRNIGCVVSVEKSKPLGILTERDIVRIVQKGLDLDKTRVSDIMSRKIISLESGSSIQAAVDLLEKNHIKKLPVIERGRLIGIVTMTDLLKSMRRIENEEEKRLRKTIKELHLTKINLQSRIIELESRLTKT
jgi:predicted transcriptional regulator